MRAVRIVIVHAPHPVGKPGSADFQKDEFDSRIPFHDAAADQRHDADHQIKRHTDHVDIKIGIFEAFLTRTIETAGDPMNAHRSAEIVGFAKKRFEIRIVEIPLPDRSRDHRADEAQIFDRAAQLLGRLVRLLESDGGNAFYSTVEGLRFLRGIVVVSAAHGGREIAVVEMGSHRHDVRISDLNIDAFLVQILEPALNVVEPR